MNLAYYLIECYTEVRRTLDEPKRPTDLDLTHYRQLVTRKEEEEEKEKSGEKI